MKTKILFRIAKLLMCFAMVISIAGCSSAELELENANSILETEIVETTVNEAKKDKTHFVENYEIVVVFDNSGSMYVDGDAMGWSRAKYAMEIFASMLNYNQREGVPGDVLKIFPMHGVVTDGSAPDVNSNEGSVDPIVIKNINDIEKIHNMFTVKALGTPFATVETAYEEIQRSSAPQKWLIVLTDGKFDSMSVNEFGTSLALLGNSDVKVQYLGIGEAANLDEYATDYFFTKKSISSENLRSDIIDICNRMFQRDQLPYTALNNDKLTLDISMDNIIVFAQGSDASITGLKDSKGNIKPIESDSKKRTYSTLSAANYPQAPYDQNLSGQVVSFSNLPKDTYTLEYANAESVQVFYTPNIDIALSFSDDKGNVIDISGNRETLYPSEYTLNYYLMDGETGEDVTDSPLIAPVVFEGGYEDSQGHSQIIENGGKVILEPDEATFLKVKSTYLNNYTISTDNRKSDYTIAITYPAIDVNLTVNQKKGWYSKTDKDDWLPVVASFTLNGKPINDIQMANTELNVQFDENLDYRIEKIPGQSKANIYIGQDEAGRYTNPKNGKYTVEASAVYTNPNNGQTQIGKSDKEEFKIKAYPEWVKWTAMGLSLLALLAFIIWWREHKSLPAAMYLNSRLSVKKYTLSKSSTVLIPTITYGSPTCKVKPLSAHKDRSSNRARVEIYDIVAGSSVKSLGIGNKTYTASSSGLVDDAGKPISKARIVLKNNTAINWKVNGSSGSGTISFTRSKKNNIKKAKRR